MAINHTARRILIGWMLLGALFATLGAAFPTSASLKTQLQPPAQVQTPSEFQDFDLISTSTGWILMNAHLYWTVDDGSHWTDITPALPNGASLLSVTFLDAHTGWVLWSRPDPTGGLSLQVTSTSDGGAHWSNHLIQDLASTDLDVNLERARMDWLDANLGWVMVTRQTGASFSAGALFHTADGGRTWIRSAPPAGGLVGFVKIGRAHV